MPTPERPLINGNRVQKKNVEGTYQVKEMSCTSDEIDECNTIDGCQPRCEDAATLAVTCTDGPSRGKVRCTKPRPITRGTTSKLSILGVYFFRAPGQCTGSVVDVNVVFIVATRAILQARGRELTPREAGLQATARIRPSPPRN